MQISKRIAVVLALIASTALVYAAASYPTSVVTFATRTNGQTIDASFFNTIQDEIVAIEGGLINGLAHDLKFTDGLFDIGKSGATRPRDIFLSRNAVVGGTLTQTGVATFTAKPVVQAGLQFPATQAADADVNTLDDYEEGNWTPVLGGSGGTAGQTYASQTGRYIKIGKLVTCWGLVTLTAKGTITTNLQIQGLPFTSATQTQAGAVTVTFFQNLAVNYVSLYGFVASASTSANIYGLTAAGATTLALATADVGNTTGVSFMVTYEAAN